MTSDTLDVKIKQSIKEEITKAIDALEQKENKSEAIHYARKRMKVVRAYLRLIRFALGKKQYKKHNIFFRDIGRKMAALRDHEVLIEKLEILENKATEENLKTVIQDLIQHERHEYTLHKHQFMNQNNILDGVIHQLKESRENILNLPVKGNTFTLVRPGLKKVYKRGHEAFKNAYKTRGIEEFHEFRKRVKYLSIQLKFLENCWKKVLKPFRKEIAHLSELLGEDHDFGMLIETFEQKNMDLFQNIHDEITRLAEEERLTFEEQAHPLAMKIYSESPGEFIHRIETYWEANNRMDDEPNT